MEYEPSVEYDRCDDIHPRNIDSDGQNKSLEKVSLASELAIPFPFSKPEASLPSISIVPQDIISNTNSSCEKTHIVPPSTTTTSFASSSKGRIHFAYPNTDVYVTYQPSEGDTCNSNNHHSIESLSPQLHVQDGAVNRPTKRLRFHSGPDSYSHPSSDSCDKNNVVEGNSRKPVIFVASSTIPPSDTVLPGISHYDSSSDDET